MRSKRINIPGAFYHVMLRGIEGRPIFVTDQDRCKLCIYIQEAFERFGGQIHAFCFMTNHIHLIVRSSTQPLSAPMHRIASRYASYFNRTHERRGYLFQDRFKAILTQEELYLKRLVRYVHLNPVRAMLVDKPSSYKWSSHNVYLGKDQVLWVEQGYVLSKFGETVSTARQNLENYVFEDACEDMDIDFDRGTHEGIILGDDNYFEHIWKQFEELPQIPQDITAHEVVQKVSAVLEIPIEEFHGSQRNRVAVRARGLAAFIVREIPSISLKDLSVIIGRDSSALGRAANQIERLIKNDDSVSLFVAEIRSKIQN